jgi:hypothetical protein
MLASIDPRLEEGGRWVYACTSQRRLTSRKRPSVPKARDPGLLA